MSESDNLWDNMGKEGFSGSATQAKNESPDLNKLPDETSLQGHPYLPFLHKLEKPARYVGGELHSVLKPDADIKIALAFPDTYEIGMSHLGYRILYSHLNDFEDVQAERVYAPWVDLEKELRERELPLVSLEHYRKLSEFDCVGFSLQYELTYTNVLTMLDLGGIPIRSADRADDHPLILAGGPNAFQPEPISAFIDAFLIGDGEKYFEETVRLWSELGKKGLGRIEKLRLISQLDGIYVPSLYESEIDDRNELRVVGKPLYAGVPEIVKRAHIENLEEYPWPAKAPIPNTEVVFDRASIEIARGCTEGCRFCQAGMIYRPVRERSPKQIVGAVKNSMECGGFDEIGLTSLSTADYSAIQPLFNELMETVKGKKTALSVSSLRAYGLSEELLDGLASIRSSSLTFAPEAGTQRMRDVINKNVTEEHIRTSAKRIFERGWSKMKCYFMIGLPTETDEDIVGIADVAKELLAISKNFPQRNRVSITISASSHVPKPFTPFQWAAMDDIPEIERKQDILARETRAKGLKFRKHVSNSSHLEGIVARGDRDLCDLIEEVWKRGARFDSWADQLRFDLWMEVIEDLKIDRWKYLRSLPLDGRLPWDHIDCGTDMNFLRKEYKKSLKDRLSPPCGKPFPNLLHHTNIEDAQEEKRKLVCYACGIACDMTQMRDERIEFLEDLGAHRNVNQTRQVTGPIGAASKDSGDSAAGLAAVDESYQPTVMQNNKYQPPKRAHAGEQKLPYRIRFAKYGAARFLSQLDLVRIIPRIFRRADTELAYSQGFSPTPLLSYGPPMPLGMAGFGEMLEAKLVSEIGPEELVEKLNQFSPDGLVFLEARAVEEGEARMSRECSWADYLVFTQDEEFAKLSKKALSDLCEQDELIVERFNKKKRKTTQVDLAGGLHSIQWLTDLPKDCDSFMKMWPGDQLLHMRVSLQSPVMVRPEEVIKLLFDGRLPKDMRVVRQSLLGSPEESELLLAGAST